MVLCRERLLHAFEQHGVDLLVAVFVDTDAVDVEHDKVVEVQWNPAVGGATLHGGSHSLLVGRQGHGLGKLRRIMVFARRALCIGQNLDMGKGRKVVVPHVS